MKKKTAAPLLEHELPEQVALLLTSPRHTVLDYRGYHFTKDAPVVVEREVAERMLSLGYMQRVSLDSTPLDGFVHISGPARSAPLNVLSQDDLNNKRVLLRRYGAIGDVIFVVQIAAYLKRLYPKVHITLAVNKDHADFVSMFSHVDETIMQQTASTISVINSFDYIITFAGVLESRPTEDENFFKLHFDRAGMQLPLVNGRFEAKLPFCCFGERSKAFCDIASMLLQFLGIGDTPYIAVLMGTSNPIKTVSSKIIQAVCERLATGDMQTIDTARRFRVLCIGGAQDPVVQFPTLQLGEYAVDQQRKLVELGVGIETRIPTNSMISIANHQPLAVSLALVRSASVVVGGDTGLMQAAMALGVPTVSLWGPTDPDNIVPCEPGECRAIKSKNSCVPCRTTRLSRCAHKPNMLAPACMSQFDVDEITQAARSLARNAAVTPGSPVVRIYSVAEAAQNVDNQMFNITVHITEAKRVTGGAFYLWNLARSLAAKRAVNVLVLVDHEDPAFLQDVLLPVNVRVVYDPTGLLYSSQGVSINAVVLSPPSALQNVAGVAYARDAKQLVQLAGVVYETPAYIAEFRSGADADERYWRSYKKALLSCNHIWCISQAVKDSVRKWDKKFEGKQLDVVSPCVFSDVADGILPDDPKEKLNVVARSNTVVMIGRHVAYKQLKKTMELICEKFAPSVASKEDPFTLMIIGEGSQALARQARLHWQRNNIQVIGLENATEAAKWSILCRARALVHNSLFEGFGIPIAEAMYAYTPAIVKRLPLYSECFSDYPFYFDTDEEMLAVLQHVWLGWEDSKKGSDTLNGFLYSAFQFTARRYTSATQRVRVNLLLIMRLGFTNAALMSSALEVSAGRVRVALVTSWGNRCGIAETTRDIVSAMSGSFAVFAPRELAGSLVYGPDESFVHRCWDRGFKNTAELLSELDIFRPTVVHFEHEFSMYRNEDQFFKLCDTLREAGIKVVVTLHTFGVNRFTTSLKHHVDCVVTTKKQDVDLWTSAVIPLPVRYVDAPTLGQARESLKIDQHAFVVGTHGFWHPHKGITEFLATYSDVEMRTKGKPVVYVASGFVPAKSAYFAEARRRNSVMIELQRIRIFPEYSDYKDIVARLAACDVCVFYYNVVNYSSASSAIRDAMILGKPCICTDSPMFSEFEHEKHVLKVPIQRGTDGDALQKAIIRLFEEPTLRTLLAANAKSYAMQERASQVAALHMKLYEKLVSESVSLT